MKSIILLTILVATLKSDIISLSDEYLNIQYDTVLKSPIVVTYTITPSMINAPSIRKRPSFKIDRRLKRKERTSTSWYLHSQYDRGHIATDAVFDYSKKSLASVYLMSNIIPQDRRVNRISWRALERYVRLKARNHTLNVINIIEYSKGYKTYKNRLNIPTGFYKIISYDDKVECYYYSNVYDNKLISRHSINCKDVKIKY